MSQNATGIPKGYGTVTPYLRCRNAADAIDFYKKAFGAEELQRMTGPTGMGWTDGSVRSQAHAGQ